MTPDDLMALTTETRPGQRCGKVHLPLMGATVGLHLVRVGEDWATPHVAAALDALLAVGADRRPDLVRIVAEDCRSACDTRSFGHREGAEETEAQANRRAFGLAPDGTSPPVWFKPSWLPSIAAMNVRDHPVYLTFQLPWSDEHGLQVALVTGALRQIHA